MMPQSLSKILLAFSFVMLVPSVSSQFASAASPTISKPGSASISKSTVEVDCGTLAKTTHSKVMPKVANVRDDIPFMNGEPEHIELTFDNDKADDPKGMWPRKVIVYPLMAYGQLFKGREKVEFDKTIASLKSIIAKKGVNGVKAIPMLPPVDMYEVFHNHAHMLDFKNGSGVVCIACYGQDEGPLSNGDFFYSYQGISSDGRFYVSVTYPVSASKLKKDTPAKAGEALLKGLRENEFSPSLNDIDKMVQSIAIK